MTNITTIIDQELICHAVVPPTVIGERAVANYIYDWQSADDTSGKGYIRVPAESVDAYRADPKWNANDKYGNSRIRAI